MTASSSNAAPLVAVMTPVYDGAAFLAEAMDAVQAQSYPNLVHVVLDNASTDATPTILRRYAGGRVPVIVKRNARTLPMGSNWNATLAHVPAEAKYFRILCADDLMAPDFIARTVELAERAPSIGVVGCAVRHRVDDASLHHWEPDREVFPGAEAARRFFLGQGQIIAHQTLMRRRDLERRGTFFDETLIAYDTDAVLDILRHGDWGFVHDTLAVTRDHPATQSATIVNQMKLHTSDFLALLERHAAFAFGAEEGRRQVRKYRRYYLRQLIRLRLKAGADVFARHMAALSTSGAKPRLWDYLDAVADWPLARLGLRPVWSGYPF